MQPIDVHVQATLPREEVELQKPGQKESGTSWLRINNKTNKNYAIFTFNRPFASIKKESSKIVDEPIPYTTASKNIKGANLAIKDPENNMKTLLQISVSWDTTNYDFAAFLFNMSPLQTLSHEVDKIDLNHGVPAFSLQLTLDGENLEKSKLEIVTMQQ